MAKVKVLLDKNVWVRKGEWKSSEIEVLNTHRFITAKSVVYLINLSKDDFINKKNKWLKKIKEYIDTYMPGEIIPYSAEYERGFLSDP